MQVPGLGHAVGRVGEGEAGGGASEAAEPELAREQVGAEEAQRPRPQEQQVVADERGDRARAEERRGAVAEQRVREGEAQRVRVEGVGVEQVQRAVEHRVPHPRDLPGCADRVAEIGRDAAGHVQDQRPARENREQHAGEHDERDLTAAQRRRWRPAACAACLSARRAGRCGGVSRRQRARARASRLTCAAGWGGRCSSGADPGLMVCCVGDRADRRSIREPPAALRSTERSNL